MAPKINSSLSGKGKYRLGFHIFYEYLGSKVFILLASSIFVALLDGVGLAMFIPLLQMLDGKSPEEPSGTISIIPETFESMGLPYNTVSVLSLMLIFFSLKGLVKFIEGYLRVSYQQFFISQVRMGYAEGLSRLNFMNFVGTDKGRIQNTFSADVLRVNNAFIAYSQSAQSAVMVAVYIVMAFSISLQFALLVTLGGVLSNLVFRKLYRITKATSKQYTNAAHVFQGLTIQQVANFKYLKSTGLLNRYTEKLKLKIKDLQRLQKKIGVLDILMQALREPLIMLVVIMVILIQMQVFNQGLDTIILSLLFFYRALSFLMNMQKRWNNFLGAYGSLENMSEMMIELKAGEESYGTDKIDQVTEYIRLEEVSFKYDEGDMVIKPLNIDFQAKETIAFVGESGSGKTTLLNLIIGLLPPTSGTIFVDGKNLSELDRNSFQRRVGYITQEPVIFSDTVFNNVTFWDEKTEENINRFNRALSLASIYDFVYSKEKTLNAELVDNGINLSGGQRQRLSIARELYKDIDILVMDEATSALDSETEQAIQKNIEQLKGKYTFIIVAHRLSTISNADRIVLLRNGIVEAQGSFQYLNEQSDSFREMVRLQGL